MVSSMHMTVPFLDLGPSNDALKHTLLAAFDELIDTGAFTNGPAVGEFEAAFASYCRRDECIGVASELGDGRAPPRAPGLRRRAR